MNQLSILLPGTLVTCLGYPDSMIFKFVDYRGGEAVISICHGHGVAYAQPEDLKPIQGKANE